MSDLTMDALAAEFEKLTKVNQDLDGAMSSEEIAAGLGIGAHACRKLIRSGIKAGILTHRRIVIPNITGEMHPRPRYFLVKKPEKPKPNGRK